MLRGGWKYFAVKGEAEPLGENPKSKGAGTSLEAAYINKLHFPVFINFCSPEISFNGIVSKKNKMII